MISDRMQEALIDQVKAGFYPSSLSLAMAASFEDLGLPGFNAPAKEEKA